MSSTDLHTAPRACGRRRGKMPRQTAVLLGGLRFASGVNAAAPHGVRTT